MSNKPFGFVLLGQPVTKKNSAILTRGRARILPSSQYMEYERRCREAINVLRKQIEIPHFDMPVKMTCRYYLQSRKHYPDLTGLQQATADIISDEYKTINHKKTLVKQWLLSDDRIIKSWDGSKIAGIDKLNPRTEIIITPLKVDLKTETDPYIIKKIKEQQQENLFDEKPRESPYRSYINFLLSKDDETQMIF